ncbi:MAG: hypothetical protein AAGJ28_18470 [Pseudomonadota bacterium]
MSRFKALPVTGGVGPYRLNRFRTYFQIPKNIRERDFKGKTDAHIADALAAELLPKFEKIFNPNLATVYRSTEKYNSKDTLQFIFNVAGPDIHDDWVGVQTIHKRGFTVQTLHRNFWTSCDAKLMSAGTVGGAVGFSGGKLTFWVGAKIIGKKANPFGAAIAIGGAVIGLGTSTAATTLNADHFLAGRRSWVIGTKDEFGSSDVSGYTNIPDDAFVLETSAVERLSGTVVKLFADRNIPLDMDVAIHNVWITFLQNYIKWKGFKHIPVTVWGKSDKGMGYTVRDFNALASVKAAAIYSDMITKHKEVVP